MGGFLAPIIYSFFYLIILGALGIKMQRVTELGLNHAPIVMSGSVDCAEMGYDATTQVPSSKEAIALANIGFFSLACRHIDDRLFDVLSPYGDEMFMCLGILAVVSITLYFITSSDSGSFVDDTLSAVGLVDGLIPQRIYWAITEGACACALMYRLTQLYTLSSIVWNVCFLTQLFLFLFSFQVNSHSEAFSFC